MAVVKFLRKFFAVIFAFVFGILLLFLILIIFAKGILNEMSIDKYINSADIFEIKQDKILQSNNNNTFGQQISDELFELGISKEVTSNILNSDGLDKIISKYVYDYIQYVLFYDEMPILSSDEIIKVIDYEGVKAINGELTPEQDLIINNYIASLVNDVNSEIPTNQELINMGYDVNLIKMICSSIFSTEAFAVIIMCLVLMILLIGLCLYNLSKTIKTISIQILFIGVILVIGSMIEVKVMNMLINGEGIVEAMILKIANETFKDLFVYGISLVVIGIILLIIVAIFAKKPKKIKDNFVPIVKEKRSQVKEQLKDHIALSDDDIDKIDNTLINKKKEIGAVNLPLEKVDEKQEEINVDNQNEIPRVGITSEVIKENVEEVKPILLEEKFDNVIETENVSEIAPLENKEIVNDDEIKVVEVEKTDEKSIDKTLEKEELSYFEIDEEKDDDIVKSDIKINPLKNVDLNVISPVKGKDIEVDLEKSEQKEEDVELL